MDTIIPFSEISDTWLDITAEDMASGIAAAEADVTDDEFATWYALMEAAVKPLEMNHGESQHSIPRR